MNNKIKLSLIGLLSLAVMACMAGVVQAALTLGALSITSDGALTITGAAASTWSTSAGALAITGDEGVTITGTDTGDVTINAASTSVNITANEAAADQIKLSAAGTVAGNAINIVTTDGGIVLTAGGAANGDITLTAGDNFTVDGVTDSAFAVGASITGGTITIGGTAQTGAIAIGDTGTSVVTEISIGGGNGVKTAINIGDGTGANGINIGGAASTLSIGAGYLKLSTTATITADTGSLQGGSPLVKTINEIAVCATAGDAVTLPGALAGLVTIVTNHGVASADVFPATDDNINEAGANLAKAVAVNATIWCYAYDATNWECLTMAR